MDIHQNARLTLRSREDLVQRVSRGMTLKRAATRFNVTAKTAAKWVLRYRSCGLAGLRDRSSRPRHSPPRPPPPPPFNHPPKPPRLRPATATPLLHRPHPSRWRFLHPPPPVVRYEHP